MLYVLVTAEGAIARNDHGMDRYQDFDAAPPALAVAKGLRWLPVIDTRPDPGPGEALAGPVVTVGTGAVTRAWSTIPPDLSILRDAAIAANNAAAGKARERYLTPGTGQETTYAAKQAEVGRWIAAGRSADATAATYPWAGDRAELRAVTVVEVLGEWEAVTAAWETVGRQIEGERERINEAISAAGTPAAIQAARAGASYPSPA
ncbi:hypothetical protein [Azospirillum agricola]|uniref:hypothetical protein n=1 Tax=Azospirillum agricola TaxID=1720247 RepID=UPI000A0F3C3D|nr:hypothetical protein [Azospirillum agricola]SMH62832.1 hypothetical protein SAMN02982994_6655 [Azospirillum lipoferum]